MKKIILILPALISTTAAFSQSSISATEAEISWLEKLIVFSPFITSLLLFLVIFKVIKKSNLRVESTILEPHVTIETITNASGKTTADTTPGTEPGTITETTQKISSSRLIALLTGLTVIAIVLCLVSFYMYWYMRTDSAPVFSEISSVLLALGLGIIPYGANQAAVALK